MTIICAKRSKNLYAVFNLRSWDSVFRSSTPIVKVLHRFPFAHRQQGTQCRKPIDGQLTKMDCGLVCGSCSQDIERELQA